MVLGSGTEPATCFVAPLDLFGPLECPGSSGAFAVGIGCEAGQLGLSKGRTDSSRTQSDHIGSTA